MSTWIRMIDYRFPRRLRRSVCSHAWQYTIPFVCRASTRSGRACPSSYAVRREYVSPGRGGSTEPGIPRNVFPLKKIGLHREWHPSLMNERGMENAMQPPLPPPPPPSEILENTSTEQTVTHVLTFGMLYYVSYTFRRDSTQDNCLSPISITRNELPLR